MNLKNVGLALGLAGLGLVAGSTSAQALTFNFSTSFGNGYVSISENNPINGDYYLSDFSFTSNKYGNWNFSSLVNNENETISIKAGNVSATDISAINNLGYELFLGNNNDSVNHFGYPPNYYFNAILNPNTGDVFESDSTFPTFQQQGGSAAVPFELSPGLGSLALGAWGTVAYFKSLQKRKSSKSTISAQ